MSYGDEEKSRMISPASREFVVTLLDARHGRRAFDLLRRDPEVTVVAVADPDSMLVRMSEDTASRVASEHPEIAVEENVRYRRLA